jgi:hypothetical protein
MPLSVSNYFNELFFPVNDTAGIWWRQRRNGSFYGWYKILDSQNYMTYALPLTGGTLTGPVSGTSISAANFYGTFNGSIGSAPYLPLSGGTMTGNVSAGNITLYFGNATLFRTGDSLISRVSNKQYADNYDRIFGKKKKDEPTDTNSGDTESDVPAACSNQNDKD